MNTTVNALKNLYEAAGGEEATVENVNLIPDMIDALADIATPFIKEADEGKVVRNGALVAQTSKNIVANGTHDTTANNEVIVDVNPNSKETITGTLANPFGESQVSFTEAKAAIANGGMSGLASVTTQGVQTGGLVLYADDTYVYLIGTQYNELAGFFDTVIAWGSDWTLQYSVQGIMGSVDVIPGTATVVIDLFIHPMPDNA